MTEPIPQPPALPLLGNAHYIDSQNRMESLQHLAATYGEIMKLNIMGSERIFVTGHALFEELCDDKRFQKSLAPALVQLRDAVSSGLFTSYEGEHDWEIAHRVLMPAFGPLNIQSMFQEMHEICSQLVLKWSRLDDDEPIQLTDDFTRLTLDSIALCAMDTRFNSFYHEDMHPFVHAMLEVLVEAGNRANRPAIANVLMRSANANYENNIKTLRTVAQHVLDKRRKHPSDKKDLLNAMIHGRDPKSGEALTDDSIINNMITFLIAGHETTAGLLSFTVYQLLKSPDAYRKAQEEVDQVIGHGPVKSEHIPKLHYLQACLRESIRLNPTAPAISREVSSEQFDEVIGGGKYRIPRGMSVICLLGSIQRDPSVYGEDADAYRPDRMLDDDFEALPTGSWKPFGTGPRSCIGRPFAWQEAVLALAMIFQNFDLRLADPSYELKVKQTLTVKPDNLKVYRTCRGDHRPGQMEKRLFSSAVPPTAGTGRDDTLAVSQPAAAGKPMTVLYGSNTGTCEGLAQTLANRAVAHGFAAEITPMDSAVGKIPSDQPVLIVTATFEGTPADNAARFVEWLSKDDASSDSLNGVRYAVFGCGHRDWASTYQKIPTEVDRLLEQKGATRITERGQSDVSAGAVFDDFDSWSDTKFWPGVSGDDKAQVKDDFNGLDIEISTSSRVSTLRYSVLEAQVARADVLSGPGVNEKRQVTFRLPTGITYRAGDYLDILPMNPPQVVSRVLKRFGLAWDAEITIKPTSHTSLPIDERRPVVQLLSLYVELGIPASKKAILGLVQLSKDNATIDSLRELASASTPNKLSVLDILEKYHDLPCPFGFFLSLLPAMRTRRYSISSSPLPDPSLVSVTYGVVDAPIQDLPGARFLGVTTNYLKHLEVGSNAQIAVRKSHYSFHLPKDLKHPILMAAAGTGIAPFRGFVEERAEKIKLGQKVGPALLFIGCKNGTSDRLYAAEFDEWQKAGAVEVFYAFSQDSASSKGCKYVQDRVYAEKERVADIFAQNAKVYVCGSERLGSGVKEVSKRLFSERQSQLGKKLTTEELEKWFSDLKVNERWSSDVFA